MLEKTGAIIIEGHVQGLANTRSLGKAGIPVIVIDKGNCVAASSRYCQDFFICPDYQDDSFIDFLVELAKNKKLKNWVLIPSNDHAVYNISKNLNIIKSYYKTTIPSISSIEQIYNKINLISLAESIGIPIPKTYYFNRIKDIQSVNFKFPILIKGKNGLSFYKTFKRKTFLSYSFSELENKLKFILQNISLSDIFFQELIPFMGTNKTVSVAAFSINGEIMTYWMGVKLREHPYSFGTATLTESIFVKDCLTYSRKLIKTLNYTGVCEIEFLKDPRDGDYKLIEINARTWLWVGHAIATGVNFPLYIYKYLNNEKISYPESYKNGIKWRNPITYVVFSAFAMISGKIKIKDILKENKGEIINALWDKDDIKPFFKYLILLIKFWRNR